MKREVHDRVIDIQAKSELFLIACFSTKSVTRIAAIQQYAHMHIIESARGL